MMIPNDFIRPLQVLAARFVLVAFIFIASAQAQQQDAVGVSIIVSGPNGEAVSDLAAKDLKVKTKGRDATLYSAEWVGQQPLELAIVIDNSGTTAIERERRRATMKFLAEGIVAMLRPGVDKVTIVNFADKLFLDAEATNDPQEVRTAFERTESHGPSALFDAIHETAISVAKRYSKRRFMIVLSDGADNSSYIGRQGAIGRAVKNGIVICGILTPSAETPTALAEGKRNLAAISMATGGRMWSLLGSSKIEEVWKEVLKVMGSHYFVVFDLPAKDRSEVVPLQVTTSRLDLRVSHPEALSFPRKKK